MRREIELIYHDLSISSPSVCVTVFFLAPGGTSHPLVNSSHTHPEARHVPSRGKFLLLLIRWPSFVRLLRKFTNEDI